MGYLGLSFWQSCIHHRLLLYLLLLLLLLSPRVERSDYLDFELVIYLLLFNMALTAASAVAGLSALSAYLNAKYHIGHDIGLLKRKKVTERWIAELGMFCLLIFFTRLYKVIE